jgi:hypothetical protein
VSDTQARLDAARGALLYLALNPDAVDADDPIRDIEAALDELERVTAALREDSGAALIATERRRQVEREGWSSEHDAGHKDGDLARAAAAYAMNDERLWPWDGDGFWNPGADDLRRLVKAGALIAAEIDKRLAGAARAAQEPSADPFDRGGQITHTVARAAQETYYRGCKCGCDCGSDNAECKCGCDCDVPLDDRGRLPRNYTGSPVSPEGEAS